MKLLLLALVAFCYGNPTHPVPGDNSHYVEGESRYIWIDDDAGLPQLVDLQEPVDESLFTSNTKNGNRYFLYTRQNPEYPQPIFHNNGQSIASSYYSATRPIVVLAHGFTRNYNDRFNQVVRAALLEAFDVNIISVDWENIASKNYPTAVFGVLSVGQFLGNFLVWLVDSTGSDWNNVHLVGYSLGAHVVGNAGRTAGNRPARITGLDPAGPLWRFNNNALRASDGQYVEAIHTDAGLQGLLRPVGNADFYPNGGSFQPGCSGSGCNHRRSYELFAATVTYNHLVGRRCDSMIQALLNACSGAAFHMGNNKLTKRGRGIFGLQTEATYPY